MKIALPAITPGEWSISEHLNGERSTYPDWMEGSIVGDYRHGTATYICVCEDAEEKGANQRAISALPELLDALVHIAHSTSRSSEAFVMREHAKQALLKAGATIED